MLDTKILVIDDDVTVCETLKNYFEKEYLDKICYNCLVMSENYIKNHFDEIKKCKSK